MVDYQLFKNIYENRRFVRNVGIYMKLGKDRKNRSTGQPALVEPG